MSTLDTGPRRPLVAGLGTEDRRDDGAGLEAARLLTRLAPPEARVALLPGRATDLLDLWTGVPLAIVLDAAVSGAPPGSVHRLEVLAGELPAELPASPHVPSSHELRLPEVLELGRVLGQLPVRLVLLGIEAARWDHGRGLSDAVRAGVLRAVEVALAELESLPSPSSL
jgi:hydrogenase maturation protease